MLSMDVALSRLESAALFREYGDMLYYDAGDFFAFDGERVKPTAIGVAEKVFFTGGELTGALLVRTEAQTLVIGDDADFSYKTLYGTAATAEGRNRYRIAGGAIVDTSLGGIFAAGQPLFEEIAVPDVAVCARGALLPCKKLLSLSLPFVGSGPVAAGEEYVGELGYLFTEGQDYFVPDTLKQVTVRGGALVSFAFYHCPALEEIDACGVDPALIERRTAS